MTWTAWPSASEAALALTTASPPARPETTSARVPSLRPSTIGRCAALPSATTTQRGLAVLLDDRRRRDGQHVGVFLGDDGRIGIKAGPEPAAGVGDVDLDADRPRLRVERPGDPRDLPLDDPALHRLERHRGPVARVDLGGEGLGDVDRDGQDVGAGDDEQRRPVGARPGQVAGVDVAPDDDAVERGLDPGVGRASPGRGARRRWRS